MRGKVLRKINRGKKLGIIYFIEYKIDITLLQYLGYKIQGTEFQYKDRSFWKWELVPETIEKIKHNKSGTISFSRERGYSV